MGAHVVLSYCNVRVRACGCHVQDGVQYLSERYNLSMPVVGILITIACCIVLFAAMFCLVNMTAMREDRARQRPQHQHQD